MSKLIVALDLPRIESLELVEELGDLVSIYKVGWQLFMKEGISMVTAIAHEGAFQSSRKEVFLDLKLDDIPNTVEEAVRSISWHTDIRFFSLQGDAGTFRAAVRGSKDARHPSLPPMQFLHVPTLSSRQVGRNYLNKKEEAARIVAEGGGLVVSGVMVEMMRTAFPMATIVVPGIRPAGTKYDDHIHSLTPTKAIQSGADYLVVGRPITNASDPRQAAKDILTEIDGL